MNLAGTSVYSATTEPYDTEKMALDFSEQFPRQAFTVGQELVFSFKDKKVLSVVVKDLEGVYIVKYLRFTLLNSFGFCCHQVLLSRVNIRFFSVRNLLL
jgi:hypothetical protein